MATVNDLIDKANDTYIKGAIMHNAYCWIGDSGYYNMSEINKIVFGDEVFMRQPKIKNVIFNDPATIVYWEDRTKTVVKCEGEKYDPEKGLTMAITKKMLGNKGNYYEVIKKWVGEDKLFPEGKKNKKKEKKQASKKKTSKK